MHLTMGTNNNGHRPRPQTLPRGMTGKASVWEDVVEDLLEIKASLNQDQRQQLISALAGVVLADAPVMSHTAFSLAGRIVIVTEGAPYEECWLYDQSRCKILKLGLRPALQVATV